MGGGGGGLGRAGAGPEAGAQAGAGWAWGSRGPLSGCLQFKGPSFSPCGHPLSPTPHPRPSLSVCPTPHPPTPMSPQTGTPGPPPGRKEAMRGQAGQVQPLQTLPHQPGGLQRCRSLRPAPPRPFPRLRPSPPPPQVRQPGLAGPTPLPLPPGHRCCGATMLLPRPGD